MSSKPVRSVHPFGSGSRDIHDHLGQHVTALRIHLGALRAACTTQAALRQRLVKLEQLARRST